MFFHKQGFAVSVLNRNTKPQVAGAEVIASNRHDLRNTLRNRHFDAVADATAYDAQDVTYAKRWATSSSIS